MQKQFETPQPDERKTYIKPVILHELGLEAQAGGSTGPIIDPLDNQPQ
jgi:hypothetical protein